MHLDVPRKEILGGFEHRHIVAMRAKQHGQPTTNVRVIVHDDEVQDGLHGASAHSEQPKVYAYLQCLSSDHKR